MSQRNQNKKHNSSTYSHSSKRIIDITDYKRETVARNQTLKDIIDNIGITTDDLIDN